MHQVRISFLSCFKAVTELCRTIPGRTKLPEVVFRMVTFFNQALNHIHSLSAMQAKNKITQTRQRLRHKRNRTEEPEYIVTKLLASLVASIVCGIEWKAGQHGHAELLEGMLFCTLEHAGRLVSQAIFGEHVATSENPGNISKFDDPISGTSIRHESRYIVQILQAAFGGTERRELIAKVLASGKSTSNGQAHGAGSAPSSVLSSNFFSKIKKLLQSTLVKSAVGGTDLETLRLPTPPLEETELIVGEDEFEKFGAGWLVRSVWCLVGWDMIA